MAATIAAARACASTLLHDSLAITAFKGAIPHVMIVLDQHPNTMQCVLAEGYHQVLQELNGTAQREAAVRASKGHLLVPLGPTSSTPCGSSGVFLHAAPSSPVVSYSILPFEAENFLGDMGKMQSLLRQCGTPTSQCPAPLPQWTAEEFMAKYKEVEHYFAPLDDSGAPNRRPMEEACHDLRTGPARELLGFVLIQRNAFQNDMKKYRLRLALFDMGMRVAEHCHLECMSLAADAHVAEGRLEDAMLDDQVYSYPRSCSFSPKVAETLGKAIADSIDLGSWERQGAGTHEEVPSSVTKALQCPLVWNLFERGALCWENRNVHDDAASSAGGEALEQVLRLPITGPGTPLEIICKDASKVLTFSGGLEDCLMNTGAYVAAQQEDRNDVVKHRERFHTAVELSPEQQPESNVEQSEGAAAVQGRLKKKEYLALLRSRGEKPNKKPRVESGDDEEAASPRGSCINSSIGGTFPIGEVISESFDLSQLNGECHVFAYPDNHKQVAMSKPVPFAMTIQNGVVTEVSEDAPDDFVDLLSLVRHTEGACYVRELGIGLNPYVGLAHVLSDVTSFERQWGVHLSLGQRHPLFVKQRAKLNADGSPADGVSITGPVLKRKAGKFHIDVFVDVARLKMGKFEVDFTKGISVA